MKLYLPREKLKTNKTLISFKIRLDMVQLHQKMNFRDTSTNRKLAGMTLDGKGTDLRNVTLILYFCLRRIFSLDSFSKTSYSLKKMSGSLIIHFCLGKYSFSLNTFSKHNVQSRIVIISYCKFCALTDSHLF